MEEAFGIKSVLSNDFTELSNDLLADSSMLSGGLTSAIGGGGASFANSRVEVLLETLRSEDLVNSVGEVSPVDMGAFLVSFECLAEQLKL